MLTQEQFNTILKIIDEAQCKLDVVYPILNDTQKSWIDATSYELSKLTDYLVDEVKIEETK